MKGKELQKILQEILRNIDEGIHFVDQQGNSVLYNHAMEHLEQMDRREVLQKPFKEMFHNIHEKDSTLLNALNHGRKTIDQKQTYFNKDKKEITTINTTIPILIDGEIIGALEISKNITGIEEMSNKIIKLQKEIINPQEKEKKIKKYTFENIFSKSENFSSAISLAKKASTTSASVLIYGETGTGKELIAQSIHYESKRNKMPFLAQNCAALPESLLEGLLFGTSKGGFTGAVDRQGLFEQVNGGTLLLDEINSMPYELQAKLLRVLQEGYIRRVGGGKDIPIDVRIIATTNEDPQKLIEKNVLRRDLYYRLNVIPINIPSLRARKEEIIPLAEMFIRKYNEKYEKEVWLISPRAQDILYQYEWPGNVRELENVIMAALSTINDEHVITENNIFLETNYNYPNQDHNLEGKPLDKYLDYIEEKIIKQKMMDNKGNISKTAEELGIKRQALQYKIKKYFHECK